MLGVRATLRCTTAQRQLVITGSELALNTPDRFLSRDRPLDLSISPDYRLLLFCAGLSLVTGVAFGLVPALRATCPDLLTDLKAETAAAFWRASGPRTLPAAGLGLPEK
jgi:hypothetical protein